MRTRRILTAVNWRYALGEVLLIVVGILIALAISDWNDRRIERKQEFALLGEIHSNLVTDVAALEAKLEETIGAVGQMVQLFQLLKEPRPYQPEVDQLFGAVYGLRVANLRTAAYETLKSAGLQSVTNEKLRALIATTYDFHYKRLETEHEIEREITTQLLRPYYLKHFVDLRFWENATPIDYQAVVTDPYYKNLLHYRLAALRSNQLSDYPAAITDMKAVIQIIEAELAR